MNNFEEIYESDGESDGESDDETISEITNESHQEQKNQIKNEEKNKIVYVPPIVIGLFNKDNDLKEQIRIKNEYKTNRRTNLD